MAIKSSTRLSESVRVGVTPAELRAVQRYVGDRGLNVSQLIRRLLQETVAGHIQIDWGRPAPKIDAPPSSSILKQPGAG
jgi:hypothetical protein